MPVEETSRKKSHDSPQNYIKWMHCIMSPLYLFVLTTRIAYNQVYLFSFDIHKGKII